MVIIMATDGADPSLLRLMTWLSPAFPVGGFAYSGGLESAVRDNHVVGADDLGEWLETFFLDGAGWNDAVLLTEAWNAGNDKARRHAAAELASALAGLAERHLETTAQGNAFLEAAFPWLEHLLFDDGQTVPYPVAVGACAATSGIGLRPVLQAYLNGMAGQALSAAIRLSVLGQKQAMSLLAALEPVLLEAVQRAEMSSLDDLGSATVIADILSARHETLGVRLFRS
jgi:urease accessory protein